MEEKIISLSVVNIFCCQVFCHSILLLNPFVCYSSIVVANVAAAAVVVVVVVVVVVFVVAVGDNKENLSMSQ